MKVVAGTPLNATPVAPVRSDPEMTTLVPSLPLAGVNELTTGSLAPAGAQPGSLNDPIWVSQSLSAFVDAWLL